MNFWQTFSFLSMSLPVVQDDSLCTPIITWNSLTPPPPPPQTIFPHPQAQIQDPSQTLEQSSNRPGNLLKCLYKCIFRVINKDSSGPLHAHCCRCNLNRKNVIPASKMSITTWKKFWLFSADRIDRDKPVMIFAETLLFFFLWKVSQTEKPSWQQPSLFSFIGSLSSNRWTCAEMLSDMKAMTVPDLPCQKSIFMYKKNIITHLFILQMRKYFM